MRIAETIPTTASIGLALVLATLVLPGCTTMDKDGKRPPCARNCAVTITVPRDPVRPPMVDIEKFHLKARSPLRFIVKFEDEAHAGTVSVSIEFDRDPFEEHKGNPGKPLPVQANRDNVFKSRPYAYRQCPANDACKYDVVVRRPEGESRLDPWIIIER